MLEKLLNKNIYKKNNIYKDIIKEEQIDIKDLLSKIDDLFYKVFNSIKKEYIYDSNIHGIKHNIRVSILINYMCYYYKINDYYREILLYSGMYHDIGRINDLDDEEHGLRSSVLVEGILNNKDNKYLNILKTIISCHSFKDKYDQEIIEKYNCKDNNIKLYIAILKDCDALDRVRTNDLDIKYLRLDISKKLLETSASLYENFK